MDQMLFTAVMLDDEPIGELVLKDIDHGKRRCMLGISLVSDQYRNQGFVTKAEILALDFAFSEWAWKLHWQILFSGICQCRHVLVKLGFREVEQDDVFVYCRCDRASWKRPEL